jgi:uncharacterized RDD family membrane protein YckC
MSASNQDGFALAGLVRRLLSLAYEVLLLGGVLAFAATPYVILTRGAEHFIARPLLQLYLVLLAGGYFVWQWGRGGQTLPMKTWRLRVVARDGGALSLRQGVLRYCLALAGSLALGAGFAWAIVDREHQFLHDRLAGTRIVRDEG